MKEWITQLLDQKKLLKLDLGSGNKHKPGFVRVDCTPTVDPDILCDLNEGIPLPDNCVEEIEAVAILEHLLPDRIINIINEMWRVCVEGARIHIIVPHPSSDKQYQDPTHRSFFVPDSLSYWDKRSFHYTATDYGVKSMFKSSQIELELSDDYKTIPDEMQPFALLHFRNVITHIHFKLEVEK